MMQGINYFSRKALEKHILENGCLIISFAQEGTETCPEAEMRAELLAEKYVRKYNPKRLSSDEYIRLYARGELPWQKENLKWQEK